jgi:hypothetical protein
MGSTNDARLDPGEAGSGRPPRLATDLPPIPSQPVRDRPPRMRHTPLRGVTHGRERPLPCHNCPTAPRLTWFSWWRGSLPTRRIPCHLAKEPPCPAGSFPSPPPPGCLARPPRRSSPSLTWPPPRAAPTSRTSADLERTVGTDQPLATLTADQVTAAVTAAWARRAPATWNRYVATVRSFFGFCRRRRWLVDDLTADLERRPEPADPTKAIP